MAADTPAVLGYVAEAQIELIIGGAATMEKEKPKRKSKESQKSLFRGLLSVMGLTLLGMAPIAFLCGAAVFLMERTFSTRLYDEEARPGIESMTGRVLPESATDLYHYSGFPFTQEAYFNMPADEQALNDWLAEETVCETLNPQPLTDAQRRSRLFSWWRSSMRGEGEVIADACEFSSTDFYSVVIDQRSTEQWRIGIRYYID